MLAGSVSLRVSNESLLSGERPNVSGMMYAGPRSSSREGAAAGMLIGDDGNGMFSAGRSGDGARWDSGRSSDVSWSWDTAGGVSLPALRLMLPIRLLATLGLLLWARQSSLVDGNVRA